MNYAVWWSGICLFLASIVYFKLAQIDKPLRPAWSIIALCMVALCFDEIGSLHETVSQAAGWLGLLPFAAVFAIGFLWALSNIIRRKETRVTAILIMVGIAIFVSVAGLEFVEHNVDIDAAGQRLRLIVEEGAELVAMGILVTAGLYALPNAHDSDQFKNLGLARVASVTDVVFSNPLIPYVLLAIQITLVSILVVPSYSFFPEGNIASLFPILMFMILGLNCIAYHFSEQNHANKSPTWLLLGVVYIFSSILQVYNFNEFINQLFQIERQWMLIPPESWMATLIPWLLTVIVVCTPATKIWKRAVGHLLIILFVFALLSPEMENIYFADYLYFIFSSIIAFSCFFFIAQHKGPPAVH